MADVIGQIYDAAVEPRRWPHAIECMCGLIGSFFGSVTAYDVQMGTFQFLARWGGDPWLVGELDRKYANMMPFAPVLDRFEAGQPFNLSMAAARLGDAGVWEGPFAREWAAPAGVGDSANVVLHRSGSLLTSLALATPVERGPVGPAELEMMRLLAPHVRRALAIGDLLGSQHQHLDALEQVIDALQLAVVVVDRHCAVIHANTAASDLLAGMSSPGGQRGRFVLGGLPSTNPALANAVARASDSGDTAGSVWESVPLRLTDGRLAIGHVLSLGHGLPQLDVRPGAVAILVSTPSDQRDAPIDALAGLYGLTTAESRLLRQLARGLNRNEAASALVIADSTAKTQLDRIFLKTGTSSQAELHHLVTSLSAPVRSP